LIHKRKHGFDAIAYEFGQLADREFTGVADIDRADVGPIHQPDQILHQIIYIAKKARLAAIAIKGERLAFKGLHDEIAHHPAVIGQHPWPIGIEDPRHPDLGAVHAPVVKAQRFGDPLALVVAAADADRVDAAPVALALTVVALASLTRSSQR